jgi:hypothetical protein
MEKFGKEAKDKITGFTGIITCKISYMFGCNQYGIAPKINADGKRLDVEWFDEGRIEIIGEGISPETVIGDQPGGENFHG